jgi:DNA-binding MarR family transcriptional regulator
VTRLIAPMEKLGLVEKESHPRDARMSLVRLSRAGKTIYDECSTTVSHAASGLLGSLTAAQQKALERLFSNSA